MGDHRPSLFSRGCIAVLIATLVLLTAYMFAAPAKRSAWPGLLMQLSPTPRLVVSAHRFRLSGWRT